MAREEKYLWGFPLNGCFPQKYARFAILNYSLRGRLPVMKENQIYGYFPGNATVRKTNEHALDEILRRWELSKELIAVFVRPDVISTPPYFSSTRNKFPCSSGNGRLKKKCTFVTTKKGIPRASLIKSPDRNYDAIAAGIPRSVTWNPYLMKTLAARSCSFIGSIDFVIVF